MKMTVQEIISAFRELRYEAIYLKKRRVFSVQKSLEPFQSFEYTREEARQFINFYQRQSTKPAKT